MAEKPNQVTEAAWAIAVCIAWLRKIWAEFSDEWILVEAKALQALEAIYPKRGSQLIEDAFGLKLFATHGHQPIALLH